MEEFIWPVSQPFEETVLWKTLVTTYEDGKEQRRKKWSQPKRSYSLTLSSRSDTITNQVWDFFNARSGAYETFYFENTNESPATGELVGYGTGALRDFQLDHFPLPSGAITLTVNGVAQTETTNYTLARSTGAITFAVGSVPVSGDPIVATYRNCRIVRFAEDQLTRELFNYKLYNTGIKLAEVI
jgi:uncharacterized protein (TIGR02217 family)